MKNYSVLQINTFIKQILAAEEILYGVYICGEITNFICHGRSGHFYFHLKDETSSIKCVMFQSQASMVPFVPENGMQVVVRGNVQVYQRDGVYQVYCVSMLPVGVGEKSVVLEQLKRKLEQEGLFDNEKKRPLPPLSTTIGVVTSKTGAALQDILQILARRYPVAKVMLFPALVQGKEAPKSLLQALKKAASYPLDVLIIGRGGGASEDLDAFNDEGVVRAVATFPYPVISAVGHEVDITLVDFAADLRAPTPSAAAELAVKNVEFLKLTIDNSLKMLYNYTTQRIKEEQQRLDYLYGRLTYLSPSRQLDRSLERLQAADPRLLSGVTTNVHKQKAKFYQKVELLTSLGPLEVLKRGYAVSLQGGRVLRRVSDVSQGNELVTHLVDGELTSTITKIEKKKRDA